MIYVVLPKKAIGEVMAGQRVELPVTYPADEGEMVAVRASYNRRPTCVVRVVACEPDTEGFILSVRVAPLEHEPKLLAADSSRGYTSDPRLAMRGEPEAIDLDTLDGVWTRRAGSRHTKAVESRDLAARSARELLTVEQRMVQAREVAKRNHVDASGELALVRKFITQGRSESSVLHRLKVAERIAYREAA